MAQSQQLPKINIQDLLNQRLNGVSTNSLPLVSELPQIQQSVQQSATPQVNPLDVYKSLGINVSEQGGQYNPTTLQGLQTGIENKLNFGNQQLADLYKNPLFNAQTINQGLGEMKNYGNAYLKNLENQQGFMPSKQPKLMNYEPETSPSVLNSKMVSAPQIPQSTSPLGNLGSKALSFVGSPLGKSLIAGGLVSAMGGGAMGGLTAGLGTYAGIKQYEKDETDLDLKNKYELEDREAKKVTNSLDNMVKQYNVLKQQLELPYISENAKLDIEQKLANLEKTSNDIATGKINLSFLPEEKRADLGLKKTNLGLKRGELDFQPTEQKLKLNKAVLDERKFIAAAQKESNKGIPSLEGGTGYKLQPAAVKNISDNEARISEIDNALASVKANPESTGLLKGYTPPDILTRTDPKGNSTRSLISNISSMVIKDRSGAAVTISEMQRLRPFIPQISDSAETITTKLNNMKKAIADETRLQLESLGNAGYNVSRFNRQSNEPVLKSKYGRPMKYNKEGQLIYAD